MGVTERPRDSATLILVRRDGATNRILMGQRHGAHAFMPNKFVFPGGRFDAADSRAKTVRELDAAVMAKLMARMRGRPSRSRARGLAITALRETLEETGLLVGRRNPDEAPDLSGLIYFARAITPPGRSRRFDSRFFVADAAQVSNLDAPPHDGSGELLTLKWFSLEEIFDLDLASITKDILMRLQPYLDRGELPPPDCAVSFQFWRGSSWKVETI